MILIYNYYYLKMSNGSKIYISCPMWKPVDALLKHQRIHSKYNSDLLINYKINDINLIIETINKGLILSYETILKRLQTFLLVI